GGGSCGTLLRVFTQQPYTSGHVTQERFQNSKIQTTRGTGGPPHRRHAFERGRLQLLAVQLIAYGRPGLTHQVTARVRDNARFGDTARTGDILHLRGIKNQERNDFLRRWSCGHYCCRRQWARWTIQGF
ncbi:unnamed protein product, partial [Ectocarpus sp. 12 AP-2014]